ncbi:MAG: hypothetical protein BHV87_12110 [Clostridiales bacterium 36_14]|nr:MAG: hypothetical protein BHV87_12110 [Clostridiales bacterium 36_14]
MQERAALNIKEEMERCQPITKTNEWQFIPIRIFASKEIMSNVINPIMEKNAKEGKGLYGNITDIPEEEFMRVTVHSMMTACAYYAGGFIWGSQKDRDYTPELLRIKEMILNYVKV